MSPEQVRGEELTRAPTFSPLEHYVRASYWPARIYSDYFLEYLRFNSKQSCGLFAALKPEIACGVGTASSTKH